MKSRILLWLSAAVLAALSVGGQFLLREKRLASSPALAESAFAALGGLRAIASEIIWFRADRLQEEGRYVELAQLASMLTAMEPRTPEVWSYAAWNLAYNVSVMMPTPEDRWRWVYSGLKLLRDEGLRLNPAEAELYRELAWMFELKIGTDLDTAAPLYREKWKAIVEDVSKRGAWNELAMDERKMRRLEEKTGFSDWTDPQLSAIYWALEGVRRSKDVKEKRALLQITKQAAVLYAKNRKNLIK